MTNRYINLAHLYKRVPVVTDTNGDYLISVSDLRTAIALAAAETGEVIEVVRCKDCVCGRPTNKSDRFEAQYPLEYLYCSVNDSGVKKDGYCSYGKRKGGE
ncbi:MAG: hypothetical protein J6J01_09295 [Oscillospiraceae bacterium]|nr:hypothetical protein [Oscillospiraceae bacterium]